MDSNRHSEEGYFRAPASVKRRLKVAGRGAQALGGSWDPAWHARQAGRALDADRVQSGQREESIAQRGAGFHRSASEKSSGRGPRAGAASGKRPVATGDDRFFLDFRARSIVRSFGFRIRIFLESLKSSLKSQNQISLTKFVNLP